MSGWVLTQELHGLAAQADQLEDRNDKLRTAAGFVYGSMLAAVLWGLIGLVAWYAIA